MKSLVLLWKEVANELAAWCHTSTALDFKTVECRVENEGLSFLTISLPDFGKSFELCLEKGNIENADFLGFKRKSRGPLPLFLEGFLSQVFNPETGDILLDYNLDAVYAVRQLTLMFGKIQLPCTDVRIRKAYRNYVKTDRETQVRANGITRESLEDFSRVAGLLFSDVLSHLDALCANDGIGLRGKHGPGATADKATSNGRYLIREWPQRLEQVFPYGEFALPNWRYYHQLDHVYFPEPEAERPVKVITVPKTLKTPRIIAIEPTCMQYMQQALLEPLVEKLESKIVPGNTRDNLCFEFIGFRDQNPNRDLARKGSEDGSLATLDLSEASDRVSTVHVKSLLRNFPHFYEAVMATRSTRAQVPGHGIIPLAKFASMGSALCFPIEAMVFLTVVFIGIARAQDTQCSRALIKSLRGQVRIYGDDIIVPVDSVDHVIFALEEFGFLVNKNKSFWTGKFRESCGGDYYDGQDVTPVRLRKILPLSRADAAETISLVAFRNLLYQRGLWKTARYVDAIIERVLPHYPAVAPTSPVLGRHAYSGYDIHRMHPSLHTPLVKGYVVSAKPPSDPLDGYAALLKYFLKRGDEPLPQKHLARQGRPRAVDIKLGWKSPF